MSKIKIGINGFGRIGRFVFRVAAASDNVSKIIKINYRDTPQLCCDWVVDYKTSSPAGGQDRDEFIIEEVERYRSQLEDYAELIRKLKNPEKVKAALYFPRFDGWKEIEL